MARGAIAFRLRKPHRFIYAAGHAVHVTLPGQKEADRKGQVRTFSLASAPREPELVIATRITDTAFKRCPADLPAGPPVGIEGPYGDLTLDGGAAPVVFLAGGIGITPFRSMIVDAVGRGLSRDLTFFYSNRTAADAAFLSEVEQLASDNPRFRLLATMTDAAEGPIYRVAGHVCTAGVRTRLARAGRSRPAAAQGQWTRVAVVGEPRPRGAAAKSWVACRR